MLSGTLLRKHTFLGIIRQWTHNLAHTWNLTYCIYLACSCAAYTVNTSANDYWCLLYLRLPNIFNLIISFPVFMWSVFLKKKKILWLWISSLWLLPLNDFPESYLQCSFIQFWSVMVLKKKKTEKKWFPHRLNLPNYESHSKVNVDITCIEDQCPPVRFWLIFH